MNKAIDRPYQNPDALRIQAEIETADRSTTKRPTWAPAVVLDGELLDLCREVEYLSADDKPVARLWGVFADPKRQGAMIRTTFSKHPLPGIRCRGFEMRAGTAHNGDRMTDAMMDKDGAWRVGTVRRGHSPPIQQMQHWVSNYERRLEDYRRALEPTTAPRLLSPELAYEDAIKEGSSEERARSLMEFYQRENTKSMARWEEQERKKRDPDYIKHIRIQEEHTLEGLTKLQKKIAKEEANPDWRYKAHTRMTELATQRMLQFVGDPGVERMRGSQVTGACCCCGKGLTDKISVERGIGPECIRHICTLT